VETVSWNDCQEYIKKLNDIIIHNDSTIARSDSKGIPENFKFSLPTEAQWEYACRAGTTTAYHFGDTLSKAQANWGDDDNVEKTMDVGSYPANAWGLWDMHGNVDEWCLDCYGDYPSGAVTDSTGAGEGSFRVFHGGSWDDGAGHCWLVRSDSKDTTLCALAIVAGCLLCEQFTPAGEMTFHERQSFTEMTKNFGETRDFGIGGTKDDGVRQRIGLFEFSFDGFESTAKAFDGSDGQSDVDFFRSFAHCRKCCRMPSTQARV
jgi:hypothetical protein